MNILSHACGDSRVWIKTDSLMHVEGRFSSAWDWLDAQRPDCVGDVLPDFRPLLRELAMRPEVQEIWIDGTVITVIVSARHNPKDHEEKLVEIVKKYPVETPPLACRPSEIILKVFRLGS